MSPSRISTSARPTLGVRPKRPFERRPPDLMLSWLFFENDFHACKANITRRAGPSIEDNLRALREYCALYQTPIGGQVIPVWKPGAG